MQPDANLVILGGGCAGLSLGLRLAGLPGPGRTLILEGRAEYANDRTWCFWRLAPHRFEHLVARSWPAVTVRSPQRSITVDCRQTPYQMIEGATFYAAAQAAVAGSAGVAVRLGTAVQGQPQAVAGGWRVETAAGPVTARFVVDTRPPPAGEALLWQSFFGQEVACDAPVFDPSAAGLMEFAADRTDDALFHYVLPLSPRRALVETTVFGPWRLAAADLAGAQAAAVDRLRQGAGFSVVRAECGILPMGLAAPAPALGPGHCRAGLMSGAARPSTGYAFQRIQRWADAAAAAIAQGGPPPGHAPDPPLQQAMDRLFLRVLRAHPGRAPELFTRMFGGTDPRRVIRFLSDQGSIADCTALGLTLPIPLFLREILRGMARTPATARAAA